jgi:beta-1,3-galactosyl-O-glycosyl-glycoprotein beta-1,6-N-acetylglucosaminyltransferase/N-acetyllactosaminide beta-1,6-N-acetylglucosaminyltransferase/mucin type N-acetylglucosaminyltransferase 3
MEGDDPDYPIAFNILTHRSMAQVERLLRAIYRPHNSYCIHIDAKANETFQRALRAVVSCFDNVFIASKLEYVVYAGYSRLQADVNCMTDQLNSSINWRYLINTAANAYPLKTNAEITKILKIYNGANDVKATVYGSSLRWEYKHIEPDVVHGDPDGEVIRTQQHLPPPPHNLTIVKGSAYAVFSRGFVDYIVNDKVAQDYLRFCRDTFSPDEHYWNTLHHTYYNPHIHPPGSFSGSLFKYLFFS